MRFRQRLVVRSWSTMGMGRSISARCAASAGMLRLDARFEISSVYDSQCVMECSDRGGATLIKMRKEECHGGGSWSRSLFCKRGRAEFDWLRSRAGQHLCLICVGTVLDFGSQVGSSLARLAPPRKTRPLPFRSLKPPFIYSTIKLVHHVVI